MRDHIDFKYIIIIYLYIYLYYILYYIIYLYIFVKYVMSELSVHGVESTMVIESFSVSSSRGGALDADRKFVTDRVALRSFSFHVLSERKDVMWPCLCLFYIFQDGTMLEEQHLYTATRPGSRDP